MSIPAAIPAGAFDNRVLNSSGASVREQNSDDASDFDGFGVKFTIEHPTTSSALGGCNPAELLAFL